MGWALRTNLEQTLAGAPFLRQCPFAIKMKLIALAGKALACVWLKTGVADAVLHTTGDISGTVLALSTRKVDVPVCPRWRDSANRGSAHRVCIHASACGAKEKGCPHPGPCSTTTTMFL